MDLYIKCINSDIKKMYEIPRNSQGDAGLDLFFTKELVIPKRSTVLVDLEICAELKEYNTVFKLGKERLFINKAFFLMPRSSIYKTPLRMSNSIGLIDSGYRGNLKVPLDNVSDADYTITKYQRLFQIVAPNAGSFNLVLSDTLSETIRGENGFGSTGTHN